MRFTGNNNDALLTWRFANRLNGRNNAMNHEPVCLRSHGHGLQDSATLKDFKLGNHFLTDFNIKDFANTKHRRV